MKWYIAVSQQTNCAEKKFAGPSRSRRQQFGVALSILACMMLACSFFSSATQSTSPRVVILTRLPTLTPTPLPITPASDESTVLPAAPAEIATLVPMATPTMIPVVTNSPGVVDVTSTKESEPPRLTSLVTLNVRRGPGAVYEIVGKLAEGQSTRVLGRNAEGTWWQIAYPPESGNAGWVSADGAYSTVNHTAEVLVAQAPAPPTATATTAATETPSATPTSAQSDQTKTPEPTSRPTTAPRVIPTVSESGGWLR